MLTQVVNGIHLPITDTHFADQIRANPLFEGKGTYQFVKLQEALNNVRHWRGALDIGAHVGLWTRVLASYFKHVDAFEPIEAHRQCFQRNVEASNVTLFGTAVGDMVGFANIKADPANSGNSRVHEQGDAVTVIALDALPGFKYPIDFVKIDVEGYELPVVRGAERVLKEHKPVMVIEQKPGHAQRYGFGEREAVDLVLSWGAKVSWTRSGDYCLSWPP